MTRDILAGSTEKAGGISRQHRMKPLNSGNPCGIDNYRDL